MVPFDDSTAMSQSLFSHYAFVINVDSLADPDGLRLNDEMELRRATSAEIAEIKELLQQMMGFLQPTAMFVWEFDQTLSGPWKVRDESEWRYFVVAFRDRQTNMTELQTAFDLAKVELEVAFVVLHSSENPVPGTRSGVYWQADRLYQGIRRSVYDRDFFLSVDGNEAAEIASIHALLWDRNSWKPVSAPIDVRQLVSQLGQLKALPYASPLAFLGYFSILESLLTHPPSPKDPYDSITRQIKKKLNLLDNRWPYRIDYGPFGNTKPEKIWDTMYAYRSSLAHGGKADFQGIHRILGSHGEALKLVRNTTKLIIRYTLEEATLLVDLRDC